MPGRMGSHSSSLAMMCISLGTGLRMAGVTLGLWYTGPAMIAMVLSDLLKVETGLVENLRMDDMMDRPIPVLVVSGFLGSGKTTLVRHLLGEAQLTGERMAVISNEFGALGIDQALLGANGDAYVELEGGCVCCQLSDALRDTLQMLRERVDPHRIVVETSGVALPSDTQLQFWREPVCDWVEDDVAVIVVNAEQLLEGRDLHGTFEDQVTSADLLLLNKIDLIPSGTLDRLEAILCDMAPDVPILRCVHGQVAPDVLFPPDPDRLRAQRRQAGSTSEPHHHEAFMTDILTIADGIEPETLMVQLQGLEMLRAKGFVRTSRGFQLVQGVGRRIELTDVASIPRPTLLGRVVVVGRRETMDAHDV
jgi:cobalamin biosynthesis protein CobW